MERKVDCFWKRWLCPDDWCSKQQLGLLQQDPSTRNLKGFWCYAHRMECAVVKSLEHYNEFIKPQEPLQGPYKSIRPKALRELRELVEALEEKVARPLNGLVASTSRNYFEDSIHQIQTTGSCNAFTKHESWKTGQSDFRCEVSDILEGPIVHTPDVGHIGGSSTPQ